ncbi:hypothetical protein, partial [Escherichia coli]|uniref:hypothetical protein n=1 Tax=Escherichia coli TaxID=562 RepID=UPI001AD91354
MIYAIKLNPPNKDIDMGKPSWLSEFLDVFLEELIELPPKRDIDHAIDLIPRAQPVTQRSYKMYVRK